MEHSLDQIRAAVETERERFGAPGCAVVIVKDGEVLLCEGFGKRDVARDLPVTAHTLFPIASCTKTFTAAVVASLVDEGVLDFDDPIRNYLPGFQMQDPVATELLSVRDCLSHRSGLPRHDYLWVAGDGVITRDEAVAALKHLAPNKPFRQNWQYNNLMFLTAGQLAGNLLGTTYEEAVKSRILDPLGMSRTNFTVGETQADADHAKPYVTKFGETVSNEVPFASLNLVGAAGNMNSSADELVAWLFTLLGHEVNGAAPLLSDSVLSEMRTTTMPMGRATNDGPIHAVGYGLGLEIEEYDGRRLTHHGGNIDGFSSQVLTSQSEGIGIAVITNIGNSKLPAALPYTILDILHGVEDREHGKRFKTELDTQIAQYHARKNFSTNSTKQLGLVRPLEDYVGTYKDPGYGEVVVDLVDGQLTGSYLKLARGVFQHRHLEVFDLVIPVHGDEDKLASQFTHDLAGEVDALRVQFEPAVDPVRFARLAPTAHLTDELLDACVGTYMLGGLRAIVRRRGERELAMSLGSRPMQVIRPHSGSTFFFEALKIEFLDGGRMMSPLGEFVSADTTS